MRRAALLLVIGVPGLRGRSPAPSSRFVTATNAARRSTALVPEDERVTVKPVFGNLGAFVNGNMFMGLFGSDVGVKLGDADHEALRQAGGPCITTYITVHLKSGDEIYLVLRAQYS